MLLIADPETAYVDPFSGTDPEHDLQRVRPDDGQAVYPRPAAHHARRPKRI